MEKVLKENRIYLFLKVHQLRKKELIFQLFFLLLKIIYQVQEVVGKIGKLDWGLAQSPIPNPHDKK